MKKSILFPIIFICMILITSCDPASQYPLSLKVNGNPWYGASSPAFMDTAGIHVNALSTNQSQFPIVFRWEQYTVGTYQLDSVNNYMQYGAPSSGGYYATPGNPGTFVVSEYNAGDKHIVGTFNGMLYNLAKTDSILVSEGKFDLHYQ